MFDGFTRVKIGGKERPLKFGTNQTILFCELREMPVKDYFPLLVDKFADGKGDGSELRDLIWSALKDGARYVNEKFINPKEDVGDWIDHLQPETVKQIMTAFTDSLPKANRQQRRQSKKKVRA